MKVEYVSLDRLIPYVNNPKKHPPEQVKKIASSIKEFGFKVPIVVDKDFVIIAGHGRYEAAKLLGLNEVPVIVAEDLTPAQAKAFRIADNKVAESEWDELALQAELEQLLEEGYSLDLTGFDEEEYQKLLKDLEHDLTEEYSLDDLSAPPAQEYKLTLTFTEPDIFDEVTEFFRDLMQRLGLDTREEVMLWLVKKWREGEL